MTMLKNIKFCVSFQFIFLLFWCCFYLNFKSIDHRMEPYDMKWMNKWFVYFFFICSKICHLLQYKIYDAVIVSNFQLVRSGKRWMQPKYEVVIWQSQWSEMKYKFNIQYFILYTGYCMHTAHCTFFTVSQCEH